MCVLQCVAVCCSVVQCVAMCCNVLQCVAVRCSVCIVLQHVAACCSVLQRVAACCSAWLNSLATFACAAKWEFVLLARKWREPLNHTILFRIIHLEYDTTSRHFYVPLLHLPKRNLDVNYIYCSIRCTRIFCSVSVYTYAYVHCFIFRNKMCIHIWGGYD